MTGVVADGFVLADVLPEVEDGRAALGDDAGDAQRGQLAAATVFRIFFQNGVFLQDRVRWRRWWRRSGRRVVHGQITDGRGRNAPVRLLRRSVSFK